MEKNQREYYLNEQIKAIHKELGEMDDTATEIDLLTKKLMMLNYLKKLKRKP